MKTAYYVLIIFILNNTLAIAQVSETEQTYRSCKYLEEANYIINKNSIYFEKCAIHRTVDADPTSFKVLGNGLAYDVKHIFLNGRQLDITPQNPILLVPEDYNARLNNTYWKNGNTLYKNEYETKEVPKSTDSYYNTQPIKTKIEFNKDEILLNSNTLCKTSLFTKQGFTSFNDVEVVSVIQGYRLGCSQDTSPRSDFYILKNSKGYWEFKYSRENTLRFIGKNYAF